MQLRALIVHISTCGLEDVHVHCLLGISRDASRAVIRSAYLQKAKRYHPDVNQSPQAEKLFKIVQEAYQVTSIFSK